MLIRCRGLSVIWSFRATSNYGNKSTKSNITINGEQVCTPITEGSVCDECTTLLYFSFKLNSWLLKKNKWKKKQHLLKPIYRIYACIIKILPSPRIFIQTTFFVYTVCTF